MQNENVVGDNTSRSKDAYQCYDSDGIRDCRYCTGCNIPGTKDCMDVHVWGDKMERCYNSLVIGAQLKNVLMSFYIVDGCTDLYYSYWCRNNSQHLFGCFGLKHKKYCILNKQYTKEEYEQLLPKVIEHMKQTGEWGAFFPPEISLYGYNETLAQDYFPLTKQQVLARGWKWSDYEAEVQAEGVIKAYQLPDDTRDIPDDILNWAIECEVTGKPFKIIPQELKFYRQNKLPIPRKHPDQRHLDRFKWKQPYVMYDRHCAKCQKDIQTTYSPERPQTVYCDECYFKEVY